MIAKVKPKRMLKYRKKLIVCNLHVPKHIKYKQTKRERIIKRHVNCKLWVNIKQIN